MTWKAQDGNEDPLPVQYKIMVETDEEAWILVPQKGEVRTKLKTDRGNRTLS